MSNLEKIEHLIKTHKEVLEIMERSNSVNKEKFIKNHNFFIRRLEEDKGRILNER
jgi:hypothetical protein